MKPKNKQTDLVALAYPEFLPVGSCSKPSQHAHTKWTSHLCVSFGVLRIRLVVLRQNHEFYFDSFDWNLCGELEFQPLIGAVCAALKTVLLPVYLLIKRITRCSNYYYYYFKWFSLVLLCRSAIRYYSFVFRAQHVNRMNKIHRSFV